jgi:hypothetical protein
MPKNLGNIPFIARSQISHIYQGFVWATCGTLINFLDFNRHMRQ